MSTAVQTPDLGFSQQDLDDLQAIHGHLGEGDPRKEKLAGLLQQHGVEITAPKEVKPGIAEGGMGSIGLPSTHEELTAAEQDALHPSLSKAVLGPLGSMAKDYASNLYDRGKEAVHEAYEAGQNIGNDQPVIPNLGKAALGGLKAYNAAIPGVGEQANKVGEERAAGHGRKALGRALGTLGTLGIGGAEAGGEAPAVSKFVNAESNPNTLYHSYLDPVASNPHPVPSAPRPVMRAVLRDMEAAGDEAAAARIKADKATIGDLDTAKQSANRLSNSIYRSPGNYAPGLAKGADAFASDIRDSIYPAIEQAHGMEPGALRGVKQLQGASMEAERNPSLGARILKGTVGGGAGYAVGHAVAGPVGGSIGGTIGIAAAEPVAAAMDRGIIGLRTKKVGMNLPEPVVAPPASVVAPRPPIAGLLPKPATITPPPAPFNGVPIEGEYMPPPVASTTRAQRLGLLLPERTGGIALPEADMRGPEGVLPAASRVTRNANTGRMTRQYLTSTASDAPPVTSKVGTSAGAVADTGFFNEAKRELGKDASVSEVARLAQKLKEKAASAH